MPIPSNPDPFCSNPIITHPHSSFVPNEHLSQLSSNENVSDIRCLDADILTEGSLAPIHRLPVEILTVVFFLTIKSESEIRFDGRTRLQTLCLSQVCLYWREITKATPLLWASATWTIDLDRQNYPNPNFNSLGLVSHYLSLSQTSPLRLNLSGGFWIDDKGKGVVICKEILPLLLLHSDRWRFARLKLGRPAWNLLTTELETRRGPSGASSGPANGYFPSLNSLHIYVYTFVNTSVDVFKLAPNLSSLQITNFIENKFVLPYSQLESLQLNGMQRISELDVLNRCSNLRKLILDIDNIGPEETVPHTLVSIHLSKLSTLEVSGHPKLYYPVFHSFRVPSLTNLYIRHELKISPNVTKWPADDFKRMIFQSHCSLQVLSVFGHFFMTQGELHETLRMVPTVHKLDFSVYNPQIQHDLAELLTFKPSAQHRDQVLLPSLSHLEMLPCGSLWKENSDALVDMVNGRKSPPIPSVASLRYFRFTTLGLSDSKAASVIERLQPRECRGDYHTL